MKKQHLFLTLALILALLAGCTPAPSVLETPAPGNLTDPQAQPQGQQPAAEQRGPGSFDLTDPAVGLAELPRYEAVLTLRFDGTRDGQPYQVEKTYTLRVDRSIPATLLTETALQPDGANAARFSGLLGAVRYSQSAPDQPCQAVEAASGEMEFTPALMLPPLLGAEAAGEESIEGFQTQVYSFTQQALGAGEAATASGKVWVAQPGGQVVKYSLTLESDTVFGTGITGQQSWEYTLRDPGEGAVQLPESCPLPLTGIPVPDGATGLAELPAEVRFQTALDAGTLAAFYTDQLGALGYLPQGEGLETANGPLWAYIQQGEGGQTMLIVTATPAESGLNVRVVRVEIKP